MRVLPTTQSSEQRMDDAGGTKMKAKKTSKKQSKKMQKSM